LWNSAWTYIKQTREVAMYAFMGIDFFLLLWQFLGNLRNLRDSHAALAVGSSETKAGEPSSVTRIISECESALTFLNRDLGILSASISREKGNNASLWWMHHKIAKNFWHDLTTLSWELIFCGIFILCLKVDWIECHNTTVILVSVQCVHHVGVY